MRLRPAAAADVETLLGLKREVFANAASPQAERRRWAWQFEDNPSRDPQLPTALVAEDDAGIAGYFAFVPLVVELGEHRGRAADGIDLCLHPRSRGQGLGRRLVEPMWAPGFCDFPFATGLNDASRHLFSACGGTVLGGPEETAGFAYFVHDAHPPRPQGLATEEIEGFEEDVTELWDRRLRPGIRLALRRDASYLNWRYRDHPFRPPTLLRARDAAGRSRGFAVLQADPALDRAYLLELLADPEDDAAMDGLLGRAQDWAQRSGAGILYHGTRDARQHAALARADLRPVPGDVPNFVGKLHGEAGCRVEDWWVSLGDGDQLYSVGDRD